MAPVCAVAFFAFAFTGDIREPAFWTHIAMMLMGLVFAVLGAILLTGPNGSGSGQHRVMYVIGFWWAAGALVGALLDLVVR